VVKFVFFPLETKNNLFLLKFRSPGPPLPTPMIICYIRTCQTMGRKQIGLTN